MIKRDNSARGKNIFVAKLKSTVGYRIQARGIKAMPKEVAWYVRMKNTPQFYTEYSPQKQQTKI